MSNFIKKILESKTATIFVSEFKDSGKEFYCVFSLPKTEEDKVNNSDFKIYKDSNVILTATGKIPENIQEVVSGLISKKP